MYWVYQHDLLYFSTILSDDLFVYQLGTVPQTFEPILAGTIATICQVVLILRASSLIKSAFMRWAYMAVLMGGSLMGLLGAAGMTGTSTCERLVDRATLLTGC